VHATLRTRVTLLCRRRRARGEKTGTPTRTCSPIGDYIRGDVRCRAKTSASRPTFSLVAIDHSRSPKFKFVGRGSANGTMSPLRLRIESSRAQNRSRSRIFIRFCGTNLRKVKNVARPVRFYLPLLEYPSCHLPFSTPATTRGIEMARRKNRGKIPPPLSLSLFCRSLVNRFTRDASKRTWMCSVMQTPRGDPTRAVILSFRGRYRTDARSMNTRALSRLRIPSDR